MHGIMDLDFKTRHKNVSNMRLKRYVKIRLYLRYVGYSIGMIAVVAGSYVLYTWVLNFVTASNLFSLKQVSIRGYEHVMPVDIVKASGLNMGENIFSIQLKTIRKNILSIPWIESVSIRKSPPHSMDITVTERRVYCMILLDRLYYVDEHGIIFKEVTSNDSTNYPIITGFSFSTSDFMNVPVQPVVEAVSFIKELDQNSIIVNRDISELHVDNEGYTLITTDGLLIKFGSNDLLSRINKLNNLIRYFGDRIQMFSSIDLRFSNMGVLRYRKMIEPDTDQGLHTLTGNSGNKNSLKEVNNIAQKG